MTKPDDAIDLAERYWHDCGFDEGYEEGYDEGYDIGYCDGWDAAQQSMGREEYDAEDA